MVVQEFKIFRMKCSQRIVNEILNESHDRETFFHYALTVISLKLLPKNFASS